MDKDFQTFMEQLKAHGLENNIPNVSEKTGRFLNMMVRLKRPKQILEIGCANGYSTLWMAQAARAVGAKITALDFSKPTFEAAQKNIAEAGFDDTVTLRFGNALELLRDGNEKGLAAQKNACFDFVFVDGEKAGYLDFWKLLQPLLASEALVIFDDMMAFPEKTAPFTAELERLRAMEEEAGFDQILLPIDGEDGIVLLRKRS